MQTGSYTALLSGLLLMIMSIGASATTIIYSSGHGINVAAAAAGGVTLAAGNPTSGFPAASLAAAIGDGSTGIYGAYDALVLGENLTSFSAADQAAIAAFTSAGGHTVVLGAHGFEAAFLNATFGYVVTNFAASSTDHTPINRVSGTGPATLLTLNGSWFIDGAPGTLLYQRSGGGDAAFIDAVGSGTVSWLAWDFCDCGEAPADQTDWFSLLGTAAIAAGAPTEVPTLSQWAMGSLVGLLMLGGVVSLRRGARRAS
ncbi:MAG: IPTL-CTERM sorting domain-containing protein [Porticoccaceae bacterium]